MPGLFSAPMLAAYKQLDQDLGTDIHGTAEQAKLVATEQGKNLALQGLDTTKNLVDQGVEGTQTLYEKLKAWNTLRRMKDQEEALSKQAFTIFPWRKEKDDHTLRNLGIASTVLGASSLAVPMATDELQRLAMADLTGRQAAGEHVPAGLAAQHKVTRNLGLDETPYILRNADTVGEAFTPGDFPRAHNLSKRLNLANWPVVGALRGDDQALVSARELYGEGKRFALAPHVADEAMLAEIAAPLGGNRSVLRRLAHPGVGLAHAGLSGGLGLAGAVGSDDPETKRNLFAASALSSALEGVPSYLETARRSGIADKLVAEQGLNITRPGEIYRAAGRLGGKARLPIGVAMSTLPAYMAYKEHQKMTKESSAIPGRPGGSLGKYLLGKAHLPGVAEQYDASLASTANRLAKSQLFADLPERAVYDNPIGQAFRRLHDPVNRKARQVLEEDPEAGLAFIASKFSPGPLYPVVPVARRYVTGELPDEGLSRWIIDRVDDALGMGHFPRGIKEGQAKQAWSTPGATPLADLAFGPMKRTYTHLPHEYRKIPSPSQDVLAGSGGFLKWDKPTGRWVAANSLPKRVLNTADIPADLYNKVIRVS